VYQPPAVVSYNGAVYWPSKLNRVVSYEGYGHYM
jgi:hypothetical protein